METLSSQLSVLQQNISTIFDPIHLDCLARQTGFIKRKSNQIQAKDFVQLMSIELAQHPETSLEGLCDILATLNPATQISPQALGQRINSVGAAGLLKTVFTQILAEKLTTVFQTASPQWLAPFNRVFVEDSTTINLNETLAKAFRSTGGSGTKSALKVHVVYDYQQQAICEVHLTDAVTAETRLGLRLVNSIEPLDLCLRDLGYFSIDQLKQIEAKDSFYLSRLPQSVTTYLCDDPDATSIDLVEVLMNQYRHEPVIDVHLYLTAERFLTRLVAYRLPIEVVNQRRRKAKANARKKSRTPTKAHLNWLAFGFYITNVGQTIWPVEAICSIYRIRWQIELMFKQWKSLLKISLLKGSCPLRIVSYVYGRLITIALIARLYRRLWWHTWQKFDREISGDKLIKWLLRNQRLKQLISAGGISLLWRDLTDGIALNLLKQKRKRLTTAQLIREQGSFPVYSASTEP